jgi:hypothetical protein
MLLVDDSSYIRLQPAHPHPNELYKDLEAKILTSTPLQPYASQVISFLEQIILLSTQPYQR